MIIFYQFLKKPQTSVTRLGDFLHFVQLLKPFATIILPKYTAFLGIFCKVVKIYHFSGEIIFGQLLETFGDFYLVTLPLTVAPFILSLCNITAYILCLFCKAIAAIKCYLVTILHWNPVANLINILRS